jgi:hypothetical protein
MFSVTIQKGQPESGSKDMATRRGQDMQDSTCEEELIKIE